MRRKSIVEKIGVSSNDILYLKDLDVYEKEQRELIEESIKILDKVGLSTFINNKNDDLEEINTLLEPIVTRLAELQFLIPISKQKAKIKESD